MNWILLVWIITGDNHHIEKMEFATLQLCEIAQTWVEDEGAKHWVKKYEPKAKCFRRQ